MVAGPPLYGRPTWAEIDLAALVENYQTLRASLIPSPVNSKFVNPRLIPVIKADAYGHGAVPVARALAKAGAQGFAVAIVEEGVALRAAGVWQEILVLEGAWPGQEIDVLRHRLTAAVHTPEGVRRLDKVAREEKTKLGVHLKVDTGMTRLGAPWDKLEPILKALEEASQVHLAATFSHLACAEEIDPSFTREQLRRFRHAVFAIESCGMDPGELHVANSAGLLYYPEIRSQSARPGIALYGYPPAPERCPVRLKQVLTLKSKVCRVHTIPSGESVGYNRLFIAPRPTRTATLPIGYADGYRRDLTGQGKVILKDRWADVLGTVSMDMIVVDITDLPDVQEGDAAIVLGSSPRCCMDAATWSKLLGTIPYEVLCGISSRVPRVYF